MPVSKKMDKTYHVFSFNVGLAILNIYSLIKNIHTLIDNNTMSLFLSLCNDQI